MLYFTLSLNGKRGTDHKNKCILLHIFFSWGNGIFYGESLVANTITFYHRGSNDIFLFPINSITGNIYATGNVVLKNNPIDFPNVIQHFTGRLI